MGCTVKIKGLSKSFRGKKLFSGLDLSVTAGESIVVLGRSGVGKSTLLSILAALTDFDTGSVKVGDIDLKKMNRAQRQSLMLKIGYLFQEVALFDDMTLWENVAFYYLYKLHMDRQQARSLAVDKLRYVDIGADVVDFYPSQISGGMKRKVGIARAIACDPEIIMLDEPTAGLDPISARMIDEVILKCSRDLGLTTITISHDLISARHFSDRIAFLHEGKFVLVDSSDSFNKSTNPVVRDFIDAGTAP
jgi:phospholipid/cholesterol/gamma-HCH transport system ATP-binding protein